MDTQKGDSGSKEIDPYASLGSFVRNHPEIAKEEAPPLNENTKKFAPDFVTNTVNNRFDQAKIYDSKIKGKVLLLDNPAAKNSQKKSRGKQRRLGLTSKEKKEGKVYDLPAECHKYALFVPLHKLWLQYMEELFNGSSPSVFAQKILKADLHGCLITVVKSKCPHYIGVSGILVQEKRNVFNIITSNDRLLVIPKVNSVFTFKIRDSIFTLYGNQLLCKASDRAAKKFKGKPTIDL
ncbi:RNase P/MRP, p29 subunit [Basidiobolus meristosporus CBS 931.73]|uniref:Ribonuclease P protein subunit p29 n=1 Tax=Basidiobolus meristosporus CBS 931.73 TaxID=1314790 RepID=A0A1Y1XU07_9FUNG|nr:RNase P/MRP, p29 subunit [Basidiobolus meristosporus CBS 931.73]|eukprot:ORX89239.1 RNase P/MRP, p29 subunit [Basidiobolus meristosporus CBS 931.73]